MRRWTLRISLLAILLVFLVTGCGHEQSMTVSFLNVGQGDSILVQLPDGESVLVDAGEKEAGQTVVNDLQSKGVHSLNLVVATHPHSDHIGGMISVLNAFPVKSFLDSGYAQGSQIQMHLLRLIQQKKITYNTARSGQKFIIDGAEFQVLAPSEPLITGTDSDANNNSVVLKITYGKTTFLLAGDMESAERAQLLQPGSGTSASLLKVAHHGSSSGTDSDFVTRVHPQYAVISVGAGNPYGHPSIETLKALSHAQVYRTDLNGTVTAKTDGTKLSISTEH